MGFRIAYLLAQTDIAIAAAAFDLVETDVSSFSPLGEADIWTTHLVKTGWTVIWAEDELFFYEREKQVAALSKSAPVYSCIVNETVMASTAMGWRDGALVWTVHHQGDGDDWQHLDVQGAPPPLLDDVTARAVQVQSGDETIDHFFDVPLKLAALETGFRHDGVLAPDQAVSFHALAAKPPRAPGFFARLLGRR